VSNIKRWRFLTNISQALSGCHHSEKDPVLIWSHVAFSNYIHDIVADKARKAPNATHWQKASLAFQEILDYLCPDCILVLGERLWRNIPPTKPGPFLKVGKESRGSLWYYHKKGLALAGRIYHPSSGFNFRRWHPWVGALLKTASAT
jgi:hypothetical protein